MKRTIHVFGSISIVGLAVLILGLSWSCYWNPQTGSGKITLNVSSVSRTQVDTGQVQAARVYLYADNMNSRVNIGDGTPYFETALSSNSGSVTVDNVPAGSGYQLVLTLGSKPDGSTFVPGLFAQSGTFDITAGHQTVVKLDGLTTVASVTGALDANGNPYELQYDSGLLGKDIRGVAIATDSQSNSWIGAVDAHSLYRGQSFPLSGSNGSLPSGQTANSVTNGSTTNPEFLVGTSGGIIPFSSTGSYGSQTIFPQNYSPSANVAAVGMSNFGNFSIPSGLLYYYVYKTGDGRLGGITAFPGTLPVYQSYAVDLSNGNTVQRVIDLTLDSSGPNLFVATSAGAYAISPELFTAGNNSFEYLSTYGANMTAHVNGKDLFITSIAENASSVHTYVATSSGVYVTTSGTVDSYIGNIANQGGVGQKVDIIGDLGGQSVPDTVGHPFSKVVSQTDYAQIVAVSNNFLVVYVPANYAPAPPVPQYFEIPLAAVTLGDLNAVVIPPYYGSLPPSIIVAGTKGLTMIPIGAAGG